MLYAQKALVAKSSGDSDLAISYYREAFILERQAANKYILLFEKEPTRSVLFRRAAALAMNCGMLDDAMEMARQGLLGHAPNEIAKELTNICKQLKPKIK